MLHMVLIFLSIGSMFLSSIAAISQKNIKRLLAYSSIGHIGYVLIALVAANSDGIKAVSIYMFAYMVMNIAIFSLFLSLKNSNGYIEDIGDLKGLSKSNPITSMSIAIVLLSMAGIPPFIGFFGKFYVFVSALNNGFYVLPILGVLASVISAYYYLNMWIKLSYLYIYFFLYTVLYIYEVFKRYNYNIYNIYILYIYMYAYRKDINKMV